MASKLKDDTGIEFDAKRFLAEPRLKLLPLDCVGFFVLIFSLLKDSPRLGFLCDPNDLKLPISSVDLSSLTGRTQEETERVLDQIMRAHLLARSSEGILYDPEMLSKHAHRAKKQKAGSAGGKRRVLIEGNEKVLLKQMLEQNSKQTSSTGKEGINSFPSSFSSEQEPTPTGECAPTAPHQGGDGGTEKVLLEHLLKQNLKQNEAGNLLKQMLKQNPADAAGLLANAWIFAVSPSRVAEPFDRCCRAFEEALDEGVLADRIADEIVLSSKTTPKRNRREFLNQMLDRLAKQMGTASNSLATGPAAWLKDNMQEKKIG